jgi:putative hydrolase of the HAD superfamily
MVPHNKRMQRARTMRGILLDLDDTLLDDRSSTRAALEAFLVAHQLHNAAREEQLAAWRAIAARHWVRYEAGECSFLDQRRCRVRDFLGRQLSDKEADEAFLPYAKAYERSWKLHPGAAEFLERTRRIPKVIITNGERGQQLNKVRATGLSEHVIGVMTPSDCGHWKPHPNIFLAALTMLGAAATECLMVGDDLVRDIEPARKLGMRCFIVETGHENWDISHLLVGA